MFRTLFIIPLLFIAALSFAQEEKAGKERIELVRANSLEFDRSMGEDARRLIGNVRLKHGKATMDCDSAYLYAGRERLKAYGNVRIVHNDSIRLFGDSLHYDGAERMARLRSNVRVEDPEMTLWTDTLDYDIGSSQAEYRRGGRLKVHDSEHHLESVRGRYYTEEQRMHFQEDVVLTHPEYRIYSDTMVYQTPSKTAHYHGPTVMRTEEEVIYCEKGWYDTERDSSLLSGDPYIARGSAYLAADTLKYRQERGKGKAIGRVFLQDTAREVKAFSGRGRFEREADRLRLTEHPVIVKEFERDTLYLRADTVRGLRREGEEERSMIAYPDVRFYRSDIQGKCDSMSYEEVDSTFRLFQDPVLWIGEERIAGDTIRIRTREGGLRSVEIPSAPFLTSRKKPPYFDQMKGQRLKAYFGDEDRLSRIDIFGNGKTLHFPEESNEEGDTAKGMELIGMNRTLAASVHINFEEGRMRTVDFRDEPTGTLYPMADLNEKMIRLEGFHWDEEGRAEGPEGITKGSWVHGRGLMRR